MARHVLYRLHDSNGHLLYIGITLRMATRLDEHRKAKPWWPDVAEVSVQHFSSRAEVAAAEREAIRSERPLYNIREQLPIGPPKGKPKGTTPTQIRIPPDVKAKAKERAGREGATLSEVVVRLLREYVAGQPRQ